MTAEHYIQMPSRPRRPGHPIWDVGCPCGWTDSAPTKKQAKQLWRDAHGGTEKPLVRDPFEPAAVPPVCPDPRPS